MPERIQSFLPSGYSVYESSIQTMDDSVFALVRGRQGEKFLFVNGPAGKMFQDGRDVAGISLYALTWANAKALRNVFTWLKPTYAGLKASFGAGDRVGLATPGHVRA
ncbi:MAG: hypothetical protein JW860_04670, partial [Sedimentisphaerales bacterium]|nr:hypothetical protein [Sedimentisphaerales bacterium]